MIEHLAVKGYRLFRDFETKLQPGINVLIGANASGKSSLFELLRIIQSCCLGSIRRGIELRPVPGEVFHPGGELAIVWGITLALSRSNAGKPLRRCLHSIEIEGCPAPARITGEALSRLESRRKRSSRGQQEYSDELRECGLIEPEPPYQVLSSRYYERGKVSEGASSVPQELGPAESLLSRATDPRLRDSWRFRNAVLGWRLYCDLQVSRVAALRAPQPLGGGEALDENGDNLASVLLSLFTNLDYQEQREDFLRFVRAAVPEFDTLAPTPDSTSNHVVLQWVERGLKTKLSAADLSDGVLRLLILGAICCNPHPPTLICIDEPEIGLHPKVLPLVGGLLRRASQRSQVIVLTHSPEMLQGMPIESIAVMRKENGEARIVWPNDHELLREIVTDEVAGEREVNYDRLGEAFLSGELDQL